MKQLSMYSTEIDLNNDKKKKKDTSPFSSTSNPEKLILTVNEIVIATLSVTPIACPSTWSGGHPRVGMVSGTQIWLPVLPSRSPWGTATDCETCALCHSPWIDCENRAPTSPWNGSSNGTCVLSNETETCESVSVTWICAR